MTKLFIILTILSSNIILAAGSEKAAGHVSDLVYPAINFILLFSFLGWKLKKPVANMFNKNAEDVEKTYKYAEEKDKEATVKLNSLKQKIENVDQDCQKILTNTQEQMQAFNKYQERETDEMIAKFKRDSDLKLDYEKNILVNEMNSALIDLVIDKTKQTIKDNGQFQDKATKNLVSRL